MNGRARARVDRGERAWTVGCVWEEDARGRRGVGAMIREAR